MDQKRSNEPHAPRDKLERCYRIPENWTQAPSETDDNLPKTLGTDASPLLPQPNRDRASNLLSSIALDLLGCADLCWRLHAYGNDRLALRGLDTLFVGGFWLRISER